MQRIATIGLDTAKSVFQVHGALAVIRYAKIHGTKHRPWLVALLARRPTKVAAIALANKLARIAWVLMTRGDRYRQPAAPHPAGVVPSWRIEGMPIQREKSASAPRTRRAVPRCERLTDSGID